LISVPKKIPDLRFQATIYRIWMMRHVDVPEEICRKLRRQAGTKRHIPVVAIVNGRSVRTTMVPAGGGRYRITLNTTLRKAAHVDVGDLVGVELRLDRDSREIPLPPALRAVLKDHPNAWRAYQALPPGHRRQLLLYFTRAKSPRAQERAARFVLDHLIERALLQPKRPKRSNRAKN
jgi:uncharacterized protein DUF1905/bacteriocin resistance YdeI/OmpD-like protein